MNKKTKIIIGLVIMIILVLAAIYFSKEKTSPPPPPKENLLEPEKEMSYNDFLEFINKTEPSLMCDGAFDENLAKEIGLKSYKTEKGKLDIVLCGMGAYQNNYVIVYSRSNQNKIISFKEFIMGDLLQEVESKAIIEPAFIESTNTLTTLAKGRGMGDCGTIGKYLWKEDAENFELVEFFAKTECDGKFQEDWPRVFPK